MSNKFIGQVRQLSHRAGDAVSTAADKASTFVQENKPNDQEIAEAKAWVKSTANATAQEAVRLGKEVMQSELAKDAARGAAVGAVIAVPVPLIGPAVGATLGAGVGMYLNLTGSKSAATSALPAAEPQANTVIEMVTPARDVPAELRKLHDLLKEGILTQEEFDAQKKKVLGGT